MQALLNAKNDLKMYLKDEIDNRITFEKLINHPFLNSKYTE